MSNFLKRSFVLLLCTVGLCAIPVAINTGCSSTGRNAYVTSGVTHVTARAALKGWDEYLRQQYSSVTNLATTNPEKAARRRTELLNQELQVRAAYEKYQATQIDVLKAAKEFSRLSAVNTNAPPAEDRLAVAVSAASVALTALLDVLEGFGVTAK